MSNTAIYDPHSVTATGKRAKAPQFRRPDSHSLDFNGFWQQHPDVGRYLPHIIEAYITCSNVTVTLGKLDLEEAYVHIFGLPPATAPCERCKGVYSRLKQYLDEKIVP